MRGMRVATGWARNRLPEPVVSGLRRIVTAWGMATARWRMRPGFLVVGAQRGGTTTLFRLLGEHPAVVRPTMSKGIGYFDLHYDKGMRWYLSHFPLKPWRSLRGRRAQGAEPVTFESRGYYLFHPLAPERIARDLPGVKVVAMLRDPVERAYSAHRHELARGFETEPFEKALALEEQRLAGEVERIQADPDYRSFDHRHHGYLARSRYAEQLQRYVDLLGPDSVYVVDADRFFADPVAEFAQLQRWLGLPVWNPERVEQWNARSRDPISPELRAELLDYFRASDEDLERLTGMTPSWRADSPA